MTRQVFGDGELTPEEIIADADLDNRLKAKLGSEFGRPVTDGEVVAWRRGLELRDLKQKEETAEKAMEAGRSAVFQYVSYYLGFSGFVLSFVAQNTKLQCKQLWIPVLLFVTAFILAVVFVAFALQDYSNQCRRLKSLIDREHKVASGVDLGEGGETPGMGCYVFWAVVIALMLLASMVYAVVMILC